PPNARPFRPRWAVLGHGGKLSIVVDPSLTVGPPYVHRLAGWCQCFVGAVSVAEPDVLRAAVHELTAHLPAGETSANLLFTWPCSGTQR
ncbi:MAG TPA: hypothetical protein VMZ90_03915, partial [Vicinamibacterales bacterium]|nr:hypothetical protein [Vicinamibacterales bacterium]